MFYWFYVHSVCCGALDFVFQRFWGELSKLVLLVLKIGLGSCGLMDFLMGPANLDWDVQCSTMYYYYIIGCKARGREPCCTASGTCIAKWVYYGCSKFQNAIGVKDRLCTIQFMWVWASTIYNGREPNYKLRLGTGDARRIGVLFRNNS